MSEYHTIIVDDEEHSQKLLTSYVERYCTELQIIGKAKDVSEAFEKITKLMPKLVFLDIALVENTAFDLLRKFDSIDFEIIFITAYDSYAINAIKFSAVDYLLKPINIEHLTMAVKKACKRIDEKSTQDYFKFFSENLKAKELLAKIALPTSKGYVFVKTNEIIRCQASGSYTEFFFLRRKPILVSKGLKEYDELLAGDAFIRVHNSHLINMDHVAEYHKGKASYILMADKSSVEVSVRKREEFLERLKRIKA